jgi:hypothetical protein
MYNLILGFFILVFASSSVFANNYCESGSCQRPKVVSKVLQGTRNVIAYPIKKTQQRISTRRFNRTLRNSCTNSDCM